jgi:iron complex outermembrane receptor protein
MVVDESAGLRSLATWCLCVLIAGTAAVAAPAGERPPPAHAPPDLSSLSIEELMDIEIVYSASKYRQKASDAPASVSIVTAEDIKRYGYRTIAEILAGVRGFYTTYDRNYTYLGVRGFARAGDYNSRVLLLVDGHRSNDVIFSQGLIGTEGPIDVELIDRVEVIRGPSSSLYGTGAFFGVVSIITKQGKDLAGTTVSATGASYSTRNARVAYGTTLKNGADLVLGASALQSDGQELFYKEFDDPATNSGVTRNDDDEYLRLFAKLSFGHFRVEAAHSSREKGIPTASFGQVFNDSRSRTTDERSSLELKYERPFERLGNVSGRVFLDRYYYFGDYPYDAPPVTLYKDFTWGNWWGTEAQVTMPPRRGNKVTLGFEFRDIYRQDLRAYDVSPYFEYYDRRKDSSDWGVYVEDEIAVHKLLTLNLGLRHDSYSTFGGTYNPRLSIVYSPFRKTTLKAFHGKAFRAPNAYELYYDPAALGYKPGSGLLPETIEATELVLEQSLGTNLRLVGSAFHNSSKDLINLETDPLDGLLFFDNIDRLKASGLELELQRRWDQGWEVRLSSVYQKSKSPKVSGPVANSPRNLSKLNVFAPLVGKRLAAGLEMLYTGDRHTVAGTDVGGYLTVNLTLLSRELVPGLEISATLSNLLDKRYADPASEEHVQDAILQDGRTGRLKLSWKF